MSIDVVDLYDDLETTVSVAVAHELKEKYAEADKERLELRIKTERLEKENQLLKRKSEILTKNISCLFKTAQLEIQRKNNEIEELRKQIALQQRRPQNNQQRAYNNTRGGNITTGDNRHHRDQRDKQMQSRPNPDQVRDREKTQRNDDRRLLNTYDDK